MVPLFHLVIQMSFYKFYDIASIYFVVEPLDTFGPEKSVLIKEVIWFKCVQTLHLGREYVSCSERCSFQRRFHSTPTQRYFPSGLVQYLDCGGKGEGIQRLTGFRALHENSSGHPTSCVYI